MSSEPIQNPAPNEESNALDPSSVIIIHPGSKYLRLGRASDSAPKKILHAIGKRRQSQKFKHRDDFVVPRKNDTESIEIIENCRQKLILQLQKSIRHDGRKRIVQPSKKIAELNAAQHPSLITDPDHQNDHWLDSKADFIFGDQVAKISPNDEYNIHFPMRRGEINLHEKVGGSQTSIIADLYLIWKHAITNLLEITEDLANFKAVLVIPALYKRQLIKHYMTLLLKQLGFGQAFVLQDHVAATFGAGLGFACVIDVGDQKTSISCVEDGISHPETRIHLDYGGSDINQIFHYLLENIEFPYSQCQPDKKSFDAELMEKLKIENCHLDLNICGTAEKHFIVSSPETEESHRYTFYLSDECLLAPMAYFNTELLELTRTCKSSGIKYMGANPGDPEDPHDHIYLSETSRKYTKAGDGNANIDSQGDADNSHVIEDELDIINEDSNMSKSKKSGNHGQDQGNDSLLMALDQAVLKSIEACPSEEMKKKMFSTILIVGGGFKFRMADKFLAQKLALQIPPVYRQEPMEILINAKSFPADESTWRGAAILSCLGSAQELWIQPKEWAEKGQKLLREKAPFPWA